MSRRKASQVRHGLVHLTLDVPDDAGLLAWGTVARRPLAGHGAFFATGGRTARETLDWEAGECVGRAAWLLRNGGIEYAAAIGKLRAADAAATTNCTEIS